MAVTTQRVAQHLSDPDTQLMMGHKQFVQGYNAQAVVTEDQIVLAAEISTRPGDFSHLRPMLAATDRELEQAAILERPRVALADAGSGTRLGADVRKGHARSVARAASVS